MPEEKNRKDFTNKSPSGARKSSSVPGLQPGTRNGKSTKTGKPTSKSIIRDKSNTSIKEKLPTQNEEAGQVVVTPARSNSSRRIDIKSAQPSTTLKPSTDVAQKSKQLSERGMKERTPRFSGRVIVDDPGEVPVIQALMDSNTVDIWLSKKGGEYDVLGAKILLSPGNNNPKKDYITVKRLTATERDKYLPPLDRLEKVNGEIYDFSTNRKQLKQPVDLWIPCQPITHPHLQEVKLKAKYKGEEEWVYHDWKLFGDDPACPILEFNTDRLGVFLATVQPRTERLLVTDQGLLYNARINRYISLRFPKRCIDHNVDISIQILPFNMEKALAIKEEFRSDFPDLTDFELATDYYEIVPLEETVFRRAVTIKLPTSQDDFTEEHRDGIIIMRKDLYTNQWSVIDSNMKITKATISFDSRHLGRFIILRAPAKRKLRMKNAIPVMEAKMDANRRELIIFKKMMKKSWNIWAELVKPSQVMAMVAKREEEGMICVSKPEIISKDLDGVQALDAPLKYSNGVSPQESLGSVRMTESEISFTENKLNNATESGKRLSTLTANNIYMDDVDTASFTSSSRRKDLRRRSELKKAAEYLELNDRVVAGKMEISGAVQPVEDGPFELFFLENLPENYVTFEFEPKEIGKDNDIEAVFSLITENTSPTDGLVTKQCLKEVRLTITTEQLEDYFWVEPEPEPEPEPSPAPIIVDIVTPPKRDSRVEKIEEEKKEVKKDSHAYLRLSAPSKPKQIIYREPRVLTGRSLQTLSRMVEEGLTLAVYLDIPDSTITGIGFDALSNGLSLADVTYRILLRWKRSTKAKGDSAVEELANALRGMGRHDMVAVLWECHCKNVEMTPKCFSSPEEEDE